MRWRCTKLPTTTPALIMLHGLLQAVGVVPAFVESFEDVRELRLGEAVEMRDDGVEFVDHVLLFVVRERTAFHADRFGPFAEPLIGARQAGAKRYHPLPQRAIAARTRNGQRIQNVIIQAHFDETARVPIERNRAENGEQKRLVLFVAAWPE